MEKFYVLAIGPYDSVFIGPFTDKAQTYWWSKAQKDAGKVNFSFEFYTEADMHANMAEFGTIPIQEPQ